MLSVRLRTRRVGRTSKEGRTVNERHHLSLIDLRQQPTEWHRRGLSHPDEIQAMVHRRTIGVVPVEPTYADFFQAA